MASLVKNGDSYGLIWTDSSRPTPQTRESLKTDDKRVAARRKARLEHQYWEGSHDPWKRKWYQKEQTRSPLLGNTIDRFVAFKTNAKGARGWNDTTTAREKYVLGKFARLTGRDRHIKDITDEDLENFYYRKDVTSDHTRDSDYISLNTFFNWCISRGLISEKPEYRPKKPQTKIPKFIRPKRLAAMISGYLASIKQMKADGTIHSGQDGACWIPLGWMILAGTGMRPKELAHIRLKNIDSGAIIIGEGFTTKTRAERRVPLLFEAGQAVGLLTDPRYRKLHDMIDNDRLLGRKPHYAQQKMSRVFTDTWQDLFPQAPRRTLYNLKDTFAVRFLSDPSVGSSGMKLNELKEILGHASLETTQKYLKAVPYGTRLEGTIWDHLHVSI